MESKDKVILSVILTIFAGFIGLFLGAMCGFKEIGIIFSIATMGAFIVSSIEKNNKK